MRLTLASVVALATLSVSTMAAPTAHHHGNNHQGKGKVFDHILQVWFENQDFDVVNALPTWQKLAKEGILLDNFNAITHPSEPNYVAAAGGSNFGIDNDDYYNIPKNITTVYDLLEKKGLTWKVYQEDIPSVGFTGFKEGQYVRKHNPAVIFDSVAQNPNRVKNIVPGTQLDADIKASKLPNWMFYTPNMLNDAHDTNATYAGNWLDGFYKSTLSQPYLTKNALILITFDENASYPKRNRIWSLLLGDIPEHLKGTTDNTYYSHYSTLHTVEQNWDLGSLGRGDADKNANNVFDFVAKQIGYKNTVVPTQNIPLNNNTITGLLTGKSFNQTHPNGGTPPA
ncbi:phosphoesterase family-domain-containing protein [Halteromyces radiatus]|uniref:phosphoesterase family-domain-containing protein n=1 Tax=Halteromyces radiatus TaxID=101107 RepID=UPI0022201014|nr:phosphoesterase family-domain-containing protein [Halteromyces radiatus]KAI8083063.1 phosphoesterase family-domain-containing protein [Halteromyces radiatus]